jgi:hypothetical protein
MLMRFPAMSAALFLAACGPATDRERASAPAAAVRDDAATIEGVEALLREWSASGADGRWDDLKALYADDPGFYWIEQGRVAYADYAAVTAGVDQVAAMDAMIRSDVSDIVVTPLAADAASFRATTKIGFASSEFSFDFEGAFTGVAVRRDDRWKFLNGHLSKVEARSP